MLYYVHRLDKQGHLELRLKTRPVHLEYLKANAHRLFAAGPVLTPDGKAPCGSLLLVEAKDEAELKEFLAGDPYDKVGLFDTLTIQPWRKVFSHPEVGGPPG
ncbi:MAG: YciI family protein [Alphaproteobacteria bacterium]|nr:YciI family protein [Alphaproteobacteria bacterium]